MIPFAEPLPAFLARLEGKGGPSMLVDGLIPEEGITLMHGQPRDGKSLAMLEVCIALAAGVPPFQLERLQVPEALPVLYVTEEDSERVTGDRFAKLLKGHGIAARDNLHVSVRKGVNLDEEQWQDQLIQQVQAMGCRFVVLDPLRSLTNRVDQGPAELQPLAKYLRRLMSEAKCALCLVHHDTKPKHGIQEDRSRGQRVSGGGILAISDSPIHVQRIDWETSQLVPNSWKFRQPPPPLMFRIEVTDESMKLVGTDGQDREASQIELERKIQEYLKEHPGTSTRSVASGIAVRRESVRDALSKLEVAGVVAQRKGKHNSIEWFLKQQGGPQ